MNWQNLDWKALERMRSLFLTHPRTCYWTSVNDLQAYDMTFAQRIGWKWDAVLRELQQRGWTPPSRSVMDWGCGSGIAGRRFINSFGPQHFTRLSLWDHSPLACEFARKQARSEFTDLEVQVQSASSLQNTVDSGILLLSHVLNELTDAARVEIINLLPRAQAIVWVEPGTYEISRDLIAFREKLLREFRVVAPCTHQAECGLLMPANQKHWCHHFAEPPSHVFRMAEWQRFSRELGIDLRSLPYSFLVLEKKTSMPVKTTPGYSRIIGKPRHYKGYSKILSCQSEGVEELMLQKRDVPELLRALKKEEAPAIHQWQREGTRIVGVGG